MKKDYYFKILTEIIDNSIKFSKVGSKIQIKGNLCLNSYRLEISDQGIGMTTDQIQKIDSFMQFDRSIHEQPGIGLGIFIVKKILDIHKGELIFENQIDAGLKIILVFPLAQ